MIKRLLNSAIVVSRMLSVCVLLLLLAAACYVLRHSDSVNGGQALAILLAAGAVIVAIASWQPLKSDD